MPIDFYLLFLEGKAQKFLSVWLRVSYIGKIIFLFGSTMYILMDFPWKQLRYKSWEQVMNCPILWFGKIWNGSINNFNSLPFLTAQLTAPASLLAVEEWALSNTKLNLFLHWHQCIHGERWKQVEDSMLPERPRLFASAPAAVPSKSSESLGEAGHVYSSPSVSCWGSFCWFIFLLKKL